MGWDPRTTVVYGFEVTRVDRTNMVTKYDENTGDPYDKSEIIGYDIKIEGSEIIIGSCDEGIEEAIINDPRLGMASLFYTNIEDRFNFLLGVELGEVDQYENICDVDFASNGEAINKLNEWASVIGRPTPRIMMVMV